MIIIKKGISFLLLLTGLFGIIYASTNIYHYYNEYKVSGEKYEQLTAMYHEEQSDDKSLSDINSDYIGWISVEGTDIEYPVVLPKDNDYYLDHNFYHEPDKVGAIFMDYRNSGEFLGENTVIYGHNMKDESMFGSLKKLIHEDVVDDPKITLEFQGETYEWQVFSAYETYEADWMQVEFENDADYTTYINSLQQDSEKFPLKEKLSSSDKLITLATCTPNDRNERLVVQGKLIKDE